MLKFFFPHDLIALVICAVIFVLIFLKKRKRVLWTILFCIGLFPFIFTVVLAISNYISTKDFFDFAFWFRLLFAAWYIWVPALIITFVSYLNVFVRAL